MTSMVELIEKGSVRDYEMALQMCASGQTDRDDNLLAIAAHIATTNGNSSIAKSTRIRVVYDAYIRNNLKVDEAIAIIKEVQRRIDSRESGWRHSPSTYALQYGFARDVFLEAVARASSYKHFLSLAKTLSECSRETGCSESRKALISKALSKLKTIEQFREIYRLIGFV